MAINLVRKPSETPNINNYDDYRMFRYATGGYNGVVEKYGNECDYEINGSNFKIKSGEIVIDGVQSKIDSVGVELTVDNVSGTEYYTVYCEVNLSLIDNQKTEIKATKNIVNYPVIEKGDDLTENQTGIARLELYRFTTSSGEISNVIKRFKLITPGQSKNAENAENATNATNAENAETSKNVSEKINNISLTNMFTFRGSSAVPKKVILGEDEANDKALKITSNKIHIDNGFSPTQIGSETIRKYKLLWKGNLLVGDGESIETTSDLTNKNLLIKFTDFIGNSNEWYVSTSNNMIFSGINWFTSGGSSGFFIARTLTCQVSGNSIFGFFGRFGNVLITNYSSLSVYKVLINEIYEVI